ncbi:MAG TPA: hypothetical protein PKB06_06445 [Actinotalea sp.]|nr:hypothetical protein [Actinotalea sp.]
MAKTSNENPVSLNDVLYAFSLDGRRLDADLVDEYTRRFKEYPAPLTDFAIDLALDRLQDACSPAAEATARSGAVSPSVSRAISRFQNRLHQLRQPVPQTAERTAQARSARPINPFASLDRSSFRALAKRLGVNAVFLNKLRDRLIEPATIPAAFLNRVADAFGTSVDSIRSHFTGPPLGGAQFYKADQKPEAVARQSFREAVTSSGLSPEEQRELLGL